MKTKLTILTILLTISTYAQIQFERVLPPPPAPQIIADFCGANNSSIAFADIDGDNDQDLLITGMKSSIGTSRFAKLYKNDGLGNFSEVTGTPFIGVAHSSIAFADIDGDNDQDVLITGYYYDGYQEQYISKLYTNDGSGNFTEVTGVPFVNVGYSSIAFADIDGDNDQDVLITGRDYHSNRIAKLYKNDGLGNFTEVTGAPFIGVSSSSIAFADIDGDNDQDVLISGYSSNGKITKLYTNNGLGIFTEVTGTPFVGVNNSSIAFADIDGDNDQDVLISGYSSNRKIAKLYTNNGLGIFTEVTGTPFAGVYNGFIAFADIDGDNDKDVLITGRDNGFHHTAKLYTNDGTGSFTEVIGTPFTEVSDGSIAFVDVDGDNDQDVLITGNCGHTTYFNISKLYINDGSGNFTKAIGTPFVGVVGSSIAFADIDGDNDQDVLITGNYYDGHQSQYSSKLYTNDGLGNFNEVTGTPFTGISSGSIAFADIDGDNDQDVLITGLYKDGTVTHYISKLYTNDGLGNFTEVTGTPFTGVSNSSVAFADIDGDNDQDVLITGIYYDASYHQISKLYTNDGSGNFVEVSTPFIEAGNGSIAFADIDADNDQDVLITGNYYDGNQTHFISKLYTNDGSGNFVEVTGTPFTGVSNSSIAFADIDGDNDKDVLITGFYFYNNGSRRLISKLYANDGLGNFTEVTGTPFMGVEYSSIAFADIDSDNDQDILITGLSSNGKISKLYTNNGLGNFTERTTISFVAVAGSSIAFADIDGDNDKDVLITGNNDCFQGTSFLYRNITNQAGIQEFSSQSVNIFPNPGKHSFFIDTQDNKTINDISIYNLQGQKVPFTYYKEQHKIDVNLPKGIYIVSFTMDKEKKSQKIVVE